ncbi:hypothetical protein QFZ77_006441 [Paenibacillus sp. V4I3]|uniref:hypothetical protein n=1 Tax=unclassified Paenibacillus TaxID=185978 RepID=UPI00278A55E9|nr:MULTISPECIES: hypothetical protein [unclassified Paenibacillus]MDQ0877782.1 hypothetical protein [Paenibacillus sp. V4I3]MDQ0886344.1 hypothetical protein [Paenibacillus sp. V4I9]
MVYHKLVKINDQWVQEAFDRQVLDNESRYFGGVVDPATGIPWPSHTNSLMIMGLWAAALINPDSAYYHDSILLERLKKLSRFMLNFQHDDGTISPGWTNYHSPPDTAFNVVGLSQIYKLLSSSEWQPAESVAADVHRFLERTIPALLTGGIHTPNHRWVICSALGSLYDIYGIEALKERASEWLSEGLDITPDGEWTERSNGIYNAVSDINLYYAARYLERPELLESVRANLRMMMYLVHPDGEIVTDYSGRQDFGQKFTLADYYSIYQLMAVHDRDPLFAAMASLAGEAITHPGALPNNAMLNLLLHPALRESSVQPVELPTEYRKIINGDFNRSLYLSKMEQAGHNGKISHSSFHPEFGAPVARHRSGKTSATVMTEATSFFALRHGHARLLGVQLGSNFEPGPIKFKELREQNGAYLLNAQGKKGYYGPVPKAELPEAASESLSPWYLLPHHKRSMTHEQTHETFVEAAETKEGWTLRVRSDKPADVLTQVVFLFGAEGTLHTDGCELVGEDKIIWRNGRVRYENNGYWIEIDGAASEHSSTAIRNMVYPRGCQMLLVNLITPIDHTFNIRLSPNAASNG